MLISDTMITQTSGNRWSELLTWFRWAAADQLIWDYSAGSSSTVTIIR